MLNRKRELVSKTRSVSGQGKNSYGHSVEIQTQGELEISDHFSLSPGKKRVRQAVPDRVNSSSDVQW